MPRGWPISLRGCGTSQSNTQFMMPTPDLATADGHAAAVVAEVAAQVAVAEPQAKAHVAVALAARAEF